MTIELPPTPSLFSRNVAVIGAGAAGLVAGHELRREGHKVVIFEREIRVGGTWIYNPATESDPIGVDPSRAIVSSSVYESLRTNLPREVMGYRAYPFVASHKPCRDSRRYPVHREVLEYLTDFATEFGITDLVRFGTEVTYVGQVDDGRWKVRSRTGTENVDEIYDAVVICNGHYTEPRLADIAGMEAWPGKQLHSHNYRVPEPFRGQVVVVIGSSASAADISRDIAGVAKEIHIACRSPGHVTAGMIAAYDNMWLHPLIKSIHEDGFVVFEDGTRVLVNVILHCTGYKFHFPFLQTNGKVTIDDNRVGPLYKHVFPPQLAPGLSFAGVPWKVVPFPLAELQSKWISGVLSGRFTLPAYEEMMADIETFYGELEESGIPKQFTHAMPNSMFEYCDWVAKQCGCPPSEEWRKQMFAYSSQSKKIRIESYRDEWDDDHLISLAHEDFIKYGVFSNNS